MPKNLNIYNTPDGHIVTDDDSMNAMIRSIELETGSTMGMAIPGIIFENNDNPEEKAYLLLLTLYDTDDNKWEVRIGRQEVYDYLKRLIIVEAIDPTTSFIIAGSKKKESIKDNVEFNGTPITVFRFMKVMHDDLRVIDDGIGFDIDEYDPGLENGDKTITDF